MSPSDLSFAGSAYGTTRAPCQHVTRGCAMLISRVRWRRRRRQVDEARTEVGTTHVLSRSHDGAGRCCAGCGICAAASGDGGSEADGVRCGRVVSRHAGLCVCLGPEGPAAPGRRVSAHRGMLRAELRPRHGSMPGHGLLEARNI